MKSLINLLSFIHVAECQSFGRAGALLNLSTSAISKGVARLEADLGVQLLKRTTRTTTLTAAGLRYYEGCRQLLFDLQGLESEIRGESDPTRGVLKVGAPVSLGRVCLPPLLKEFARLYPDLQIEVVFDRVDLQNGEIDVFFGAAAGGPDIISHQLTSYPLVICASPGYLEERGRPFHPRDLSRQLCLGCRNRSTGKLYSWSFTFDGKMERVETAASLILNDGDALQKAALTGLGLTQIPGYLAGEALAQGALVEVLSPYRPAEIPVSVSYLNRRFLSRRVQLLVDYLISQKEAIASVCQATLPLES